MRAQRFDQAGLADPGLTLDQHHGPVPVGGLPCGMGERGQFGVAFQHAPPHVMSVEGAIEPDAASTDPATET